MTQPFSLPPKAMGDLFPDRISRRRAKAGAPVIRRCAGEFTITRRQWRSVAS